MTEFERNLVKKLVDDYNTCSMEAARDLERSKAGLCDKSTFYYSNGQVMKLAEYLEYMEETHPELKLRWNTRRDVYCTKETNKYLEPKIYTYKFEYEIVEAYINLFEL